MSEDEYEYEEVTDYKKIGIVSGLGIAGVVLALLFVGIIPNTVIANVTVGVDFFPEKTEQTEQKTDEVKPVPDQIFEKIFENEPDISSVPDEPKNVINIEPEPLKPIEERLLNEFLTFGLTEEEITNVLNMNCETFSEEEVFEPKFEKLYDAKFELCFGPNQDNGTENEG